MDLGVFYEVIVPLMEVKGTATICISTPLGSWNFYSELTEVRDEKGRRVFNVKHIEHGKRPSWKPEESFSKASVDWWRLLLADAGAAAGQGHLRQSQDAV